MPNPAVFLDRDGTLNIDPGYLNDPNLVELFPNTGKALSKLKKLKFKLIVISNQSGIARGKLKKENVDSINMKINDLLSVDNVQIDAFYYCPFHPDFSTKEESSCRKPSPKLVFQAAEELNINLPESYFVGDSESDIECGINAGIKTILVKTGKGKESFSILQKENKIPTFVAENIFDASNYIQRDFTGDDTY